MDGAINATWFGSRPSGMTNRRTTLFGTSRRIIMLGRVDRRFLGIPFELLLMQHRELGLYLGVFLLQATNLLIPLF